MAVARDNSVQVFLADNQPTLESAAFTIGTGNTVAWAGVMSGAGSPVDPTSVKIGSAAGTGGTAMSKIGSTLDIGANLKISLYELKSPPSGSKTVWADWGGNQDERAILCVTYTGVDQTTPKGTVATATGANATPTTPVVSVSGDICLDFVWVLDNAGLFPTLTVGAGQSSIQEIDGVLGFQYECAGSSDETASGTSTTMSWSIGVAPSPEWGIISFAIKAAAAGGASILKQMMAHEGG